MRVKCDVCGGISSSDKNRKFMHEITGIHQRALAALTNN
jgi:hypothetical protein